MTSPSKPDEKEVVLTRLPEPAPPPAFRLKHLMLLVLGCGVACWLLVIAIQKLGPIAVILGLLGLGVLTVAGVVVALRGAAAQRDALVGALAIAAKGGMPLAPALEAYAEQCGILFRPKVLTLADALNGGMDLPGALDRVPGVLPRDAEPIVRVGWEAGLAREALAEAAARRAESPPWVRATGHLTYLLVVALVLQGIIGFIMYFIAPKFESIFADFGLRLPANTIAVIQATHFIVKYGYVTGLLLAGEVFLLAALPLASSGLLGGWVPLLDRLFVRRHSAIVLRSLALVVEGGRPLPAAIATLARRYPSGWVRDRVRGVALDLDRGRDWCESLYFHRLIGLTDAALLDAARRAGNLAWALREAAAGGERRLSYRLQAWGQLLFPVVIVLLGLFVLTVCTAYFAPLVTLIQRLAG